MPSITVYELNTDPVFSSNVNVVGSFVVDVVDNDATLEASDTDNSMQLDVSSLPDFIGNSSNFQVFETYSGTVGGTPVTFTLIQYSGKPYMIVTSGSVSVGDTIEGTNNNAIPASPTNFTTIPSYVCFTKGTLIRTIKGEVAIEKLKVGDKVLTLDSGYQAIRWIGAKALDAIDLYLHPNLKPIRIAAGALGNATPRQDLLLSPQHRVFVRSIVAQRMFGTHEVLIPAKKLLGLDGISTEHAISFVVYYHLLLDQHEVVSSNGALTESLFPGREGLKSVGTQARQEIMAIFPELAENGFSLSPSRHIPGKGKLMTQFAYRIQKNNKCVVEPVS